MDYKNIIESKGLKHKWVAKKIGISPVLLSYYINNIRPMPEHISNRLKSVLL